MEAIKQVTNRTITTCRIWCQILPISIFSTSSHLYSSFQRLVGIFSDTNLSFPSAIHTVVQFDFIRLILAGVNNSNLHSIFLNTSYLQLKFSIANFTSEKSIRPFLTVFITKFTSATRFLPFSYARHFPAPLSLQSFTVGGKPSGITITTHKFISGHNGAMPPPGDSIALNFLHANNEGQPRRR